MEKWEKGCQGDRPFLWEHFDHFKRAGGKLGVMNLISHCSWEGENPGHHCTPEDLCTKCCGDAAGPK